jgi:hypothetical protein
MVVVVLAGAGCRADSPRQEVVRAAVQRHLIAVGGYELERTRCTDDPKPWFVTQPASVFLCAVGRSDGDCDWYRVDIGDGSPEVTLDSRNAGCILPA